MKTSHFSQSFFIEMAMVILFFSLAIAVIIRFFSQGYFLSQQSRELNSAMIAAQSLVAILDDEESRRDHVVYYDSNWEETKDVACYEAHIAVSSDIQQSGVLYHYSIDVLHSEDARNIFHLETGFYEQQGGTE